MTNQLRDSRGLVHAEAHPAAADAPPPRGNEIMDAVSNLRGAIGRADVAIDAILAVMPVDGVSSSEFIEQLGEALRSMERVRYVLAANAAMVSHVVPPLWPRPKVSDDAT